MTTPGYTEKKWGLNVGGPIIQDTLFFFGAYEKADEPRFIGQGYNTEFFPRQVVDGSIDADTGQYIYSRFSDQNVNDLNDNRSLWEARLGIEFSF